MPRAWRASRCAKPMPCRKIPTCAPYAQNAVNFILYCQDKHGGGWRYFPGQAGDTSVSGWQIMALKAAVMAGLEVPSQSFFLANKFLDSVQGEKARTTDTRSRPTAVPRQRPSGCSVACI